MSQQLAILMMIDTEAAIKAGTLDGHIYMMDNNTVMGSSNQGTGRLITRINGTMSGGEQVTEQVLNWLAFGIGSIPLSLPITFENQKALKSRALSEAEVRESKEQLSQVLAKMNGAWERLKNGEVDLGIDVTNASNVNVKDLQAQIFASIQSSLGDVPNSFQGVVNELGKALSVTGVSTVLPEEIKIRSGVAPKLMDVTGSYIQPDEIPQKGVSLLPPLILNITGDAVDREIIFPAQYGYPDLVTDGWYWAASVSTFNPGIYCYLMDLVLFSLDEHQQWVPHYFQYPGRLEVVSGQQRNGFTGGATGYLPICLT